MDLIEIDLSKGNAHEHPDFQEDRQYLVYVHNEYITGKFRRNHYGWSFQVNWGYGLQYDSPGSNHSTWEAVWLLPYGKAEWLIKAEDRKSRWIDVERDEEE